MSTAARKQAPRLARPATRYWKGKAPKGVTEVESDSDEDVREEAEDAADVPVGDEQEFGVSHDQDADEEEDEDMRTLEKGKRKAMNFALKDVNISHEGKVIVAGREESGRTAMEVDDEEDEEEEEEEVKGVQRAEHVGVKESDAESSEYESGSEDEEEDEKPKLQYRPVFVPKRARATISDRDTVAQDSPEALQKKEAEAEERRRQSHDLVAESIRRELAEKEKEELVPDVDDTDGLDPEAEFEAWRLRELGRIKRDKEAEVRREQELEEIERRRALPEDQRLKEDLERAQKSREEKPKGQQKFLQKYWHKGAFHQDEDIVKKRDYTEATESAIDVSLLPKVMQVKNFGKRSRTKYTHLLDQDTTVGTGFGQVKQGGKATESSGCFLCGGPHLKRDCPQMTGPVPPGGTAGTGANAAPINSRSWGTRREDDSWRDRGEDRGPDANWRDSGGSGGYDNRYGRKDQHSHHRHENEDRHRRRSYTRSRSRSPAPRPRRGDYDTRERRRSRSVDREYREKRRRLD